MAIVHMNNELGFLFRTEDVCRELVAELLRQILACPSCSDGVRVPIGDQYGAEPWDVLGCPACAETSATAAGRSTLRAQGYGVMS